MEEEWNCVKGYEGLYQISNFGKVKSSYKKIILKMSLNKDGYYQVVLYKHSLKPKHKLVHILVGEHFIPNPDKKSELNHIDCIKTNNMFTNLEWSTRQENMEHAKNMGLIRKDHLVGNKHACKP